jgi:hypothetical protein
MAHILWVLDMREGISGSMMEVSGSDGGWENGSMNNLPVRVSFTICKYVDVDTEENNLDAPDPSELRWRKNFGISYMTYILHPSQIQKMPKKMQVQIKKKYVHHVKQIQKMKST